MPRERMWTKKKGRDLTEIFLLTLSPAKGARTVGASLG